MSLGEITQWMEDSMDLEIEAKIKLLKDLKNQTIGSQHLKMQYAKIGVIQR